MGPDKGTEVVYDEEELSTENGSGERKCTDPFFQATMTESSGADRHYQSGTIGSLPDDVLLEIFDFYVRDRLAQTNDWHTLVHVCRRWRCVVFASPRSLDLQLDYGGNQPMTEMLDTWPALPILIQLFTNDPESESSRAGNVVAALDSEHHARVRGIRLFDSLLWERLAAAMQKPFPELTRLEISLGDGARPIPNLFLGGSAPRLRELYLTCTPLPGMHKLLLSSSDLVQLLLSDIPHSGYIPPEAMAACLSVLPRLEQFFLRFRSHRSRPHQYFCIQLKWTEFRRFR